MKIRVGTGSIGRKPQNHDIDVHTTADFGFCQPTCKMMTFGKSDIKMRINSKVRLTPLVAPTFGVANLKHYAYFVPTRQVCMTYENLISGTQYNGNSSNYIPSKVPTLPVNALAFFLLNYCKFTIYNGQYTAGSGKLTDMRRTPLTNALGTLMSTYATNKGFRLGVNLLEENDVDNITIDGADFIIVTNSGSNYYAYAFKLTKKGKNIRKVFIGLGYQLNFDLQKKVSVLPLLAYYKAWFDLFAIKRTINWQSTWAYKLIQLNAQSNFVDWNVGIIGNGSAVVTFLDELANCYYTCNTDYFTAHQSTLNNVMTNMNSKSMIDTASTASDGQFMLTASSDAISMNSQSTGIESNPWAIRAALKWLPFVNKNTPIGQKIKEWFAAHNLGTVDDDKDLNFVGADNILVQISDVLSNADTVTEDGGASLGEFSGFGIGRGTSKGFHYKANCPGFFIVISVIVPRAGYVQGIDPKLFAYERFDFPYPELDALAYTTTDKAAYVGACDVSNSLTPANTGTFGYMPLYSEFKCEPLNICNGDMSLRSTRKELLPYILDRWFTPSDYERDTTSTGGETFIYHKQGIPQVNDELRYIGKNAIFGNFDRIFQRYNDFNDGASSLEDLFIVHNMIECTIVAPAKPLADSFVTGENETHTMSVEKA